jgi:NodT family efflux transporter outer membrane factor (OMF) lipoprotein
MSRPACRAGWLSAMLVLVGGCAVGPNYHRPTVAAPAAFKEVEGWKQATPADSSPRGPWWGVFADPELDALEAQVEVSNQSLKQAEATYEAARQIARAEHTDFFPTITGNASANRSKTAAASYLTTTATVKTFSASLQAAWEPDFWGSVRRQTEADVATAEASAAALASARLSLQASLAQDYIDLRIMDDNVHLLQGSIDAYKHSLEITQNKYGVGVSTRSDVLQAQTQLDSTRAQMIAIGVQRSAMEHAIAVLIGKAPADFSIAPRDSLGLAPIALPPQLPSNLLERRPDIAEAERQVASANASIGVRTAAYYPNLSLTGNGGYEGSILHRLLVTPDRFWSLGLSVSESLFNYGQTSDFVKEARANYNASVANYRQTVLSAFQQVEDELSALGILAQEADVQSSAVAESAQATVIALNEYKAGTVDYTTVVTAQVTELNNRETALNVLENRLTAGVTLMTALGGGWDASQLPNSHAVLR